MSEHDRGTSIAAAFREGAGAPSGQESGGWNINATARAELDNARGLDEALGAHDLKWREERRKIATASDPYPDFDLGSRAHRNILSEYGERRTVWEMERDGIERSFATKRDDIRSANPTLSEEFAGRERDALRDDRNSFSFTAPERETDRSGPNHDAVRGASRTL